MKEGIDLGTRRSRSLAGRIAVLAVGLSTAALAVLWVRAHRDVSSLRAELAATEDRDRVAAPAGEAARRGTSRLRAALSVGAPAATAPSEVLRLVASTLPEEMTLVSLSVGAPPRRTLLIEAVAARADAVTKLQQNVAASPMVSATRLLEERRASGGGLHLRFEVDLVEPRTR